MPQGDGLGAAYVDARMPWLEEAPLFYRIVPVCSIRIAKFSFLVGAPALPTILVASSEHARWAYLFRWVGLFRVVCFTAHGVLLLQHSSRSGRRPWQNGFAPQGVRVPTAQL